MAGWRCCDRPTTGGPRPGSRIRARCRLVDAPADERWNPNRSEWAPDRAGSDIRRAQDHAGRADRRGWIQSAFGQVNWVRNLRVSGDATLTRGQRGQSVIATELSPAEAAVFFGDVLTPYIRHLPLIVRSVLPSLLGLGDILKDPKAAAERHPVFELHAV